MTDFSQMYSAGLGDKLGEKLRKFQGFQHADWVDDGATNSYIGGRKQGTGLGNA